MKTGILSSLVLASVLSLSAFGCAAQDAEGGVAASGEQEVRTAAREVKATTEARFGMLSGVWGVRSIQNKEGLDLAIIEAGGGDPAMNGNQLFLTAYGPHHGDGGTYELGLNISQLKTAELVGKDTVKLTGTYDDIDAKTGDVKSGNPFEATIKLTITDNNVGPTVTVTRGASAEQITKTTDEGFDFFSTLFEVKQKESKEGTIVRLFDTGKGGDPAMNGGQLVLSIMSYPEEKTFDLGLNILTVDAFDVPNEKQIKIGGTEHYMDAKGEIKVRPYAYTVDFSIGQDGSPAEAIKVTRTN